MSLLYSVIVKEIDTLMPPQDSDTNRVSMKILNIKTRDALVFEAGEDSANKPGSPR